MTKLLKKKSFGIVTCVAALLFFIAAYSIPDYHYSFDGLNIHYTNPASFASSKSGRTVIVDDQYSIYVVDAKEKVIFTKDIVDFDYANGRIKEAVFDDKDNLYVRILTHTKESCLSEFETIVKLNKDGNIEREIVGYDYKNDDNPPGREGRIKCLDYYNGELRYFYETRDKVTLISSKGSKPAVRSFELEKTEAKFIRFHADNQGGWIYLKQDGEIGKLHSDGTTEKLYTAEYQIRTGKGTLIKDIFPDDGNLYMLCDNDKPYLAKLQGDSGEAQINEIGRLSVLTKEKIVPYASITVGRYLDHPAISVGERLYTFNGEKFESHNGDFSISSWLILLITLKNVGGFFAVIFIVVSLISVIGNILKWRLSVLSKQLLITIPLVIITLGVVIGYLSSEMLEQYSNDKTRELIAISEIAAKQFQDVDYSEIDSSHSAADGTLSAVKEKIYKFVNGNRDYWNKNYTCSIFMKKDDDRYLFIARNDEINEYLRGGLILEKPLEKSFYKDSHTVVTNLSYVEGGDVMEIMTLTPIYTKQGDYECVIMISSYEETIMNEIWSICEKTLGIALIFTILLTIFLTVASAVNARSLKKAKEIVSEIANGNFDVRIEKYSNDEIGQICAGVNDMAKQLQYHFEEKDKNERFYYKFVPEKFKELLHKEEFTDLVLGDAQSMDLTVLFCDIRAFSLNSEMMTARESFEFVNKVYGKAGPIIRRYNGFVDKYIGDAVMALFESADDAVAAGIALYNEIAKNPDVIEEFGISTFDIGIGIHSGMAQIGIVGEEERMSGTVISDTVNLSSRLETLTKQYKTPMLISKATVDRMKDTSKISMRYLGMVQAAGVNGVVSIYEVLECLNEEKRIAREKRNLRFRDALRLFHSGHLEEAREQFDSIQKDDASDYVAELYSKCLDEKIESNDRENNVFKFYKK